MKRRRVGGGGGRVIAVEPPMTNLLLQYREILRCMCWYRSGTVHGLYPRARSFHFYQYVRRYGVRIANISRLRLARAILFMEECYRRTVQERGRDAVLLDRYLRERFKKSSQIWGVNHRPQDGELRHALNVEVLEDRPESQEAQNVTDVAIFRAIIRFVYEDDGDQEIRGADSVEFYNFVSLSRVSNLENIQQDRLVNRIMMLEENFRNPVDQMVTGGIGDLAARIYQLSWQIWGDDDDDQ